MDPNKPRTVQAAIIATIQPSAIREWGTDAFIEQVPGAEVEGDGVTTLIYAYYVTGPFANTLIPIASMDRFNEVQQMAAGIKTQVKWYLGPAMVTLR